jgi:hypothetical protein
LHLVTTTYAAFPRPPGGDVHLHLNISATHGVSVLRMFQQHGPAIAKHARSASGATVIGLTTAQ